VTSSSFLLAFSHVVSWDGHALGLKAKSLRSKALGISLEDARSEVEKLIKSGPETVTMGKMPQTPRAKKVIEYAVEESRGLGHKHIGTEHLLLGLLREADGLAAQVLIRFKISAEAIREEVLNFLGIGEKDHIAVDKQLLLELKTLCEANLKLIDKALAQ